MASLYETSLKFPGNSPFVYGFLKVFDPFNLMDAPVIVRSVPDSPTEGLEQDAAAIRRDFQIAIDAVTEK